MSSALAAEPCSAEDQEETGQEEATENPAHLLDEASTLVQHLQQNWACERRTEIDQLWHQLEAEYELVLPKEAPDTPAVGRLHPKQLESCLIDAPSEEDVEISCAVHSTADVTADEAEADKAVHEARRDLEATRKLRQRLEASLAASSSSVVNCEAFGPQAAAQDVEAAADNARLDGLRREVERLRSQSASLAFAAPPSPTGAAAAARAAVEAAADGPGLTALDAFVDEMRMFSHRHETSSSHGRANSMAKGKGALRAVASPQRVRNGGPRSPSSGSPGSPSKKEMARLAEERAMEWVASGRQSLGSPIMKKGKGSPKNSAPPLATSLLSTRSSFSGEAVSTRLDTLGSPSTALERQLDDILLELDEIDRIHEDVCMLAKP